MLDRIRGITDQKLLLEDKDEFIMKAGKHGLFFSFYIFCKFFFYFVKLRLYEICRPASYTFLIT